jgi:ribosome-binding protein aMBF1 (putative translation factor)
LAKKLGFRRGQFGTGKRNSAPSPEQKGRLKEILGNVWTGGPKTEEEERAPSQPGSFGSWLSRSRVERGLSVPELAEKVKLSTAAIYNIEAGRIANPQQATVQKLQRALDAKVPNETKDEIREEATIEGVGQLLGFDPHSDDDLPSVPGIYVLYDVSERPIYVGQGSDIKRRIRDHSDKFWFKSPIVETGAFVQIADKSLREKVETLLIRFLQSNAVINRQNVDR